LAGGEQRISGDYLEIFTHPARNDCLFLNGHENNKISKDQVKNELNRLKKELRNL
jgi:hypothetical protein